MKTALKKKDSKVHGYEVGTGGRGEGEQSDGIIYKERVKYQEEHMVSRL